MMKCLIIQAEREGYHPNQLDSTMTVAELIDHLRDFDPALPVFVSNDNGFTYGTVDENKVYWSDIEEDSDDEEDAE